MEKHSVTHADFTVERDFAVPPARVFAAFADPAEKEKWSVKPAEFDFRVGGREKAGGCAQGGPVYTYAAQFLDIVPDHRIVFVYDMYADDRRISASLGTLELWPSARGTRVKYTEQVAFLDGLDDLESRRGGTESMYDTLGASLTP